MLTLQTLEILRQVAAAGSYAGAARAMAVTQPAVSQQIRKLEIRHGIALFDRMRGDLVATPLCLSLCDIAETILREHADAERLLRRSTSLRDGLLTVGTGNLAPAMEIVARFRRLHPGLTIRVTTGTHEQIVSAVLQHEVDVGILPDVPVDGRFQRRRLLANRIVAVVPTTSPLGGRTVVGIADLAKEPLVFRTRGSSTQRAVDRLFAAARINPSPALVVDTREGVCEAVAHGIGCGFVWEHSTSRVDGFLRIPLVDEVPAHNEHVFALNASKGEVVRAFLNIVGTEGG